MGLGNSTAIALEEPSDKHTATLYYFSGRGKADQIRWMLAATEVDFTQKVVGQRDHFVTMSNRQLPFGQLPLLQIDSMEIVQSQAIIRYLAKRSHLEGKSIEQTTKCDMIAEAINDFIPLLCQCPFRKYNGTILTEVGQACINVKEWEAHRSMMLDKWSFLGNRLEAILRTNLPLYGKKKQGPGAAVGSVVEDYDMGDVFMVGRSLTYADILTAHLVTWLVEECGTDAMRSMPLLVALQHKVFSLSGDSTCYCMIVIIIMIIIICDSTTKWITYSYPPHRIRRKRVYPEQELLPRRRSRICHTGKDHVSTVYLRNGLSLYVL